MQIVILAAGRGTRMNNLTDSVPKPMLKIKGKPILAYKVEALPREIDEVILVVGYHKEQIMEFFGDRYDERKMTYVQQYEFNGTAGALHSAKDFLRDDFIVMMGDDLYMREDIERCMKNDLAMLVMEVDDSSRFGIVTLNEKGQLLEVVEKPKIPGSGLVCVALYKLNKKFFDYPMVSIGKGEYGLPQTLALMAKDHPVQVVKATDWFPIGNPDELKKAQDIIDKFI